MIYWIEDADGYDLLGCEQEGVGSARLAARTLVMEDGEPYAQIRRDGDRFPGMTYTLDKWGNLSITSSDLTRSWT